MCVPLPIIFGDVPKSVSKLGLVTATASVWFSGGMEETSYSTMNSTRLSLAGRAPVGEWELPCQSNDLASVPLRDPFWSSQREQPLGLRKLPQVQLWAAKRSLDAAGIRHLGDLLMIGLEGEGIEGEGRRLVFDFEGFFVDPHGDLCTGEPIFAKEPPVDSRERSHACQDGG
jgi:hypothetical protein